MARKLPFPFPMAQMFPPGDFDKLPIDKWDKVMLQDAYNAVSSVNGWNFMASYTPEQGRGFMFSEPPPKMREIEGAMKYEGHSGASYGMTMRIMEFIAKNGWDTYVDSLNAAGLQKRLALLEAENKKLKNQLEQQYPNQSTNEQKNSDTIPQTEPRDYGYANACWCHRQKGLPGWCGVAGGGVPACDH